MYTPVPRHDHRLHSHRTLFGARTRWSCVGITVSEHVALAPYTTLGVGGPARFFVSVTTVEALQDAITYAHERSLKVAVLGGGSNCLVSDEGFDGLVIHLCLQGISINDDTLSIAAGENWDDCVECAIENGLQGIECLSGIPGTVGGAIVQNIGAYGAEIKDVCVSVDYIDVRTNTQKTLSGDECEFAYRSSIFKGINDRIVVGATLRLSQSDTSRGQYAGLPSEASLRDMRNVVLSERKKKGMLEGQHRSAGSFFTNPVISRAQYDRIQATYHDVPMYPVDDAHVKVPAAWLIEHAGIAKGSYNETQTVGTSPDHALSIVTYAHATTNDVHQFAECIATCVYETFTITLTREVTIL